MASRILRERPINSCLRIAKLVQDLTSPVICDVIDSFFGCTAAAPMTKGLQSRCITMREKEHQMNSDLDELSCCRLHFIQSAVSLMQLVETYRRCWTSVELGRQKP